LRQNKNKRNLNERDRKEGHNMIQKTILKQHQENHEKYKDSICEYDIHEDKNTSILPSEVEIAIMELRHRKRVG